MGLPKTGVSLGCTRHHEESSKMQQSSRHLQNDALPPSSKIYRSFPLSSRCSNITSTFRNEEMPLKHQNPGLRQVCQYFQKCLFEYSPWARLTFSSKPEDAKINNLVFVLESERAGPGWAFSSAHIVSPFLCPTATDTAATCSYDSQSK